MKFINTKRFSPVIFEGDVPDKDDYFHMPPSMITPEFLKKGDYFIDELWWSRQRDRCLNGYEIKNAVIKGGDVFIDGVDALWSGNDCYIHPYDILFRNGSVHISGRMYWYLNFFPIYRKVDGKMSKTYSNPKFLALDYFFADRIEKMFFLERDGQEFKGRQEGFSMKLSGMIAAYNYTFIDDSQTIIVAGHSDDADYTFTQTDMGLSNLQNTQFYKDRSIDNEELIQSRFTGSSVRKITARDNPQALSRFSPFFIIYEEIGKGKREWSLKVARYVNPSLYTEGKKTGWQIFVGTAGEEGEATYDLEKRHYNPDEFNLLSFLNIFEEERDGLDKRVAHFTGKDWYGNYVDEDGNPEREKTRIKIREDQAKMEISERLKNVTQMALYVSDALATSTMGFFGDEVIVLLKRRKIFIQSHSNMNIVRKGRLRWLDADKPAKGVEFIPDEKGWLSIIEQPEVFPIEDETGKKVDSIPYGLYYGGVDSYDQDEARTSDSKGAMYVRKMFYMESRSPFYNTYVAQIIERPTVEQGGAETFYEHCAMLSVWYNLIGALNIEYSNLRIFQWFIDHGLEAYLALAPRMAFAMKVWKNSMISNKYGTDKSLKPQSLAITRDRLTEEFINNMWFPEQLDRLANFKYDPSGARYNCDVTMATSMAEIVAKENEFTVVKKREELSKPKGYQVFRRDTKGNLVQSFI